MRISGTAIRDIRLYRRGASAARPIVMRDVKNPSYRVLLPVWDGGGEPNFELTPGQRNTILGGKPYRVAPSDKCVPVHERASSCESLLAIYPDAISIGGVLGESGARGDVAFGAWMTLVMSTVFGVLSFIMLVDGFWAGGLMAGFGFLSGFFASLFF